MDWKSIVASVAPTLGAALGGPLAGLAVKQIADHVLGNPNASRDEVAAFIQSGQLSGEQIVALKQAEQTLQTEMARLDIDRDALYLRDTQGARQQTVDLAQAESKIAFAAPVLSGVIIVGFFSCIWLLFLSGLTYEGRVGDLLNVLFGALIGGFTQVCNYWLGSSAGSKRSGDAVRSMVAKATAKAE